MRKPEYRKDTKEEEFLYGVNSSLMPYEICRYEENLQEFPSYHVFGVPRSGTTLLAQLLAYCFDLGYINNLVARFWYAPVVGIKLSRALGIPRQITCESNYARTEGLGNLHEFGYFWRYWLKLKDWEGLRIVLLNMQRALGGAVVFKNIFGAEYLEDLQMLLPEARFIHITRDPFQTCLSILEARKAYNYDLHDWWSTKPPEYDKLKDLPYYEQIAAQVFCLRRLYDSKQAITISYESLCMDPTSELSKIGAAVRIPPRLRLRTRPLDTAEARKFKEILDDYRRNPPA